VRRAVVTAVHLAMAALALWWVLIAAEAGVGPSGWWPRARSEVLGQDDRLAGLLQRVVHPAASSPADIPAMALGRGGRPLGWQCGATILWEVDRLGLPADGVATIAAGLARISVVSGLRFAFVGTTTASPAPSWRPLPGGPAVLVGWVRYQTSPMFAPPAPGDAVAMTVALASGDHLTGAVVAFDAGEWAALTPGFGAGVTQGELALHELEHVAGIGDQVRWPGDLSFRRLLPRPAAAFGSGDRTGLRKLGCPVSTP
jgi:hypothetical protein